MSNQMKLRSYLQFIPWRTNMIPEQVKSKMKIFPYKVIQSTTLQGSLVRSSYVLPLLNSCFLQLSASSHAIIIGCLLLQLHENIAWTTDLNLAMKDDKKYNKIINHLNNYYYLNKSYLFYWIQKIVIKWKICSHAYSNFTFRIIDILRLYALALN